MKTSISNGYRIYCKGAIIEPCGTPVSNKRTDEISETSRAEKNLWKIERIRFYFHGSMILNLREGPNANFIKCRSDVQKYASKIPKNFRWSACSQWFWLIGLSFIITYKIRTDSYYLLKVNICNKVLYINFSNTLNIPYGDDWSVG